MDSLITTENIVKVLEENANTLMVGKDSCKRLSDETLDGGGKRRTLSDVTNTTLMQGKSSTTTCKTSSFSSTVEYEEPITNTSHCSEESTSDVSTTTYTTAVEACDSPMDMSVFGEDSKSETDETEEDFDNSSRSDIYSVSDYASDIFSYYREREKQLPIVKYLDKQKEISKFMRAVLVDWLAEIQESFELNHETLYLSVKLVDFYLMQEVVPITKLQLLGAVAVFIASKYDDSVSPLVLDFIHISDDSFKRSEFLEYEIKLLKAVNFDLGFPLSYRFLRRFARCARITMKMLTLARFILETALMDYELIEHLDSKMAAAALLLGLRMMQSTWTSTLEKYTGYKAEDLEEIVLAMNKNISIIPAKHLRSIRTKYSHPIFFRVAEIPPLKLEEKI